MEIKWNEEYREKYKTQIRNKLPASFAALYDRSHWFHDWYLENFYLASSGRFLQNYSKKRCSTFEMQLCDGNGKRLLLSYLNIRELDITTFNDPEDRFDPCFDVCVANLFDIVEDGTFSHVYKFANGDSILIRFEKIKCKWIRGLYEFLR